MEAVEAFALVAGHVDEELLLRNEYLAAENEILLSKLSDRVRSRNLGAEIAFLLAGLRSISSCIPICTWLPRPRRD